MLLTAESVAAPVLVAGAMSRLGLDGPPHLPGGIVPLMSKLQSAD